MNFRQIIRRGLNLPGWETAKRRIPTWKQWRQIFYSLTPRERLIFSFGLAVIAGAALLVVASIYFSHTKIVPEAGGNISIGAVGRPLHINPILAPSNPADEDLARLVFAGLFRYDQQGALVPDLAESYAIGDFGKVIEVTLRPDIVWPDGNPFIADDVAYTVATIKDPSIHSPLFENWNSVTAEVLDFRTIRFILPSPYPPFLHNLTVGILPKHIWEGTEPGNFSLSEQNLKPVGLGPYRPVRFERTRDGKVTSYSLEPNPFSPRKAFISRITFRFFDDADAAVSAFNRREVTFFSPVKSQHRKGLRNGARLAEAALPRTFSIFLNQTASKGLSEQPVRAALAHAIDRGPIIEALGGTAFAAPTEQPIPHGMFGSGDITPQYPHDVAKAKDILEQNGWTVAENGIRAKKTEQLAFTLAYRDTPENHAVVELLRAQWSALNVEITPRPLAPADYRTAISDREYQMLLAGTELPMDPDPYAFWHSSQKFDPGGNIGFYDNRDADKLLEDARNDFTDETRAQKYAQFQAMLLRDIPVLVLWQERYVSALGPVIYGFSPSILANPSWRFGSIDEWYVQTKRVWK